MVEFHTEENILTKLSAEEESAIAGGHGYGYGRRYRYGYGRRYRYGYGRRYGYGCRRGHYGY
ncbi:MAG: hypothetical protein QNJ51_18340 [Calothrix sp. MO_167.B12]|nr:hypothetical protein [Calothrix sp. MO_167.B12]